MSIVRSPAFQLQNLALDTRPAQHIGDFAVGADRPHDLNAEVRVHDDTLRQTLPGYDGRERVFALVPRRDDGNVTWARHDLRWAGSASRRTSQNMFDPKFARDDRFRLQVRDVDVDTVRSLGVAFGIETDRGTVWAQNLGANFRPRAGRGASLGSAARPG